MLWRREGGYRERQSVKLMLRLYINSKVIPAYRVWLYTDIDTFKYVDVDSLNMDVKSI